MLDMLLSPAFTHKSNAERQADRQTQGMSDSQTARQPDTRLCRYDETEAYAAATCQQTPTAKRGKDKIRTIGVPILYFGFLCVSAGKNGDYAKFDCIAIILINQRVDGVDALPAMIALSISLLSHYQLAST
jgi:hypothetical protein